MPIQHEDTCVPSSNPLQCAYYNKDHKIVNMLGYELVEEKILPLGTLNFTFADLDGDLDEEYLVELDLTFTSASTQLQLFPNGSIDLANTCFSQLIVGENTNSAVTSFGYSGCVLSYGYNIACYSEFRFFAKTGKFRRLIGAYTSFNSSNNRLNSGDVYIYWPDSTTPLTSIFIQCATGSISGVAKLFKRIPLDGGV